VPEPNAAASERGEEVSVANDQDALIGGVMLQPPHPCLSSCSTAVPCVLIYRIGRG
jgi:hypothetical protein